MNQFLMAAHRGSGVIGRLGGAQLDERGQDRFNEALARVESAHKIGDHIQIAAAEEHLDSVLEDVRGQREQPEPPSGFDGGVRGRRPVAPPPQAPETAGAMFRRALRQSQAERAERGDDERTIVANT